MNQRLEGLYISDGQFRMPSRAGLTPLSFPIGQVQQLPRRPDLAVDDRCVITQPDWLLLPSLRSSCRLDALPEQP